MKFAMFYEIPVAKPWGPRSEYEAYQHTIEQAKLGDRMGFHSFWTVEHHFLDEYSHCSNPEVLYGHLSAVTKNLRLGYGVRLLPKPYNHPVRTAESVATLDLISGGRVEFGTGRSSTRAEIEGFGISPLETREMWDEALRHIVGCWTNDEYEFSGKHWSMPPRRVHPKPFQDPHPPIWGATSSVEGHYEIGVRGLGLLSFTVGNPPEQLEERIHNYRRGQADCNEPVGKFRNSTAATFTMVHCNDTNEKARAVAEESFVWYPKTAALSIASLAEWMAEGNQDLGNYGYAGEALKGKESNMFDSLTMDYLYDSGAGVVGDPDRCVEICRRYEAVGCELLFCLLNPYKIPHEEVMRSIELLGKHVIPEFRGLAMGEYPPDIYTEADGDPDTLANLGPLGPLAGIWESAQGADDHPVGPGSDAAEADVAAGTEHNVFVERYELEPIDPQTNGPQLFYGLRYHVHIVKPGEVETFHDQVGYWLWEPAAHTVTHTLAIPRGQVLLASGTAEPDATTFEVAANLGSQTYGILSNPFLDLSFRTLSFRMHVTVNNDGTWSYEEDTVLQIPDREEPFHHVDRNTLTRVGQPVPNPVARNEPPRSAGSAGLEIGSLRNQRGNLL